MLNDELFDRRCEKVANALERAKNSMMNEAEDKTLRPILRKVRIIERVKPEDTIGPIPGANQVPFILSAMMQEDTTPITLDLPANWIDDTAPEAMIPHFVSWVRQAKIPIDKRP